MVTLDMVNQYALDNNLGDDTDIFLILSQMQLEGREARKELNPTNSPLYPPPAPEACFDMVEYSIEDLLNLFNT